jgi:hypothetical protein
MFAYHHNTLRNSKNRLSRIALACAESVRIYYVSIGRYYKISHAEPRFTVLSCFITYLSVMELDVLYNVIIIRGSGITTLTCSFIHVKYVARFPAIDPMFHISSSA